MVPNLEKVTNERCRITKVGAPDLEPTNQSMYMSATIVDAILKLNTPAIISTGLKPVDSPFRVSTNKIKKHLNWVSIWNFY